MKITFNLSASEVKGIKNYLKAVDGIEKPTTQGVKNAFDWKGFLYAQQESVSRYILQAQSEEAA